ncbi:MAG: hypothetical protein EPN85_11430 [Bacteroidetes bacterium]|nr:MAG: hypothetical protein EPN85_11430 [Bacteroidota bacterium]
MKQIHHETKTPIIYAMIAFLFAGTFNYSYSQAPPAGACLGTFPSTPFNSTNAWLRGGNLPTGAGAVNNRFGTCFNSPIYTITDGTLRTWLNGRFTATGTTAQPAINSVTFGNTPTTVNTSGYFGIGFSGPSSPLQPNVGTGPMALLHLQGPNNTPFPAGGAGWRSWMKTGTYMVENTDGMYVGLKKYFAC